MSPVNRGTVVAVDPGSTKCGIAVVSADGQVLHRDIVPTQMIGETVDIVARDHRATRIALGSGTRCQTVLGKLLVFRDRSEITTVPEANTTLLARKRYWEENSPGCLLALLPAGMRIPPRPVDDYAAVVIAQRFLAGADESQESGSETPPQREH